MGLIKTEEMLADEWEMSKAGGLERSRLNERE